MGSLPDECTEEALKAGFAAALPDLTAIDCEVVSSSNTQSIIVVICLKKDSRRVYDYLRSLNFVRASGGDNENIKAAMDRHGKISKRFRRTLTATRKNKRAVVIP